VLARSHNLGARLARIPGARLLIPGARLQVSAGGGAELLAAAEGGGGWEAPLWRRWEAALRAAPAVRPRRLGYALDIDAATAVAQARARAGDGYGRVQVRTNACACGGVCVCVRCSTAARRHVLLQAAPYL
jgi:hypothetical protein